MAPHTEKGLAKEAYFERNFAFLDVLVGSRSSRKFPRSWRFSVEILPHQHPGLMYGALSEINGTYNSSGMWATHCTVLVCLMQHHCDSLSYA